MTADGGPPLSYQWLFNGAPIADATSRILSIANLEASHAGSYFVTVSNRVSRQTSSSGMLNVEAVPRLPTIVAQPEPQDIPAGYGWTLRVVAVGTAPLEYQWLLNGTNLPNATNAALVFASVQSSNAGVYTVHVSNHQGAVLSLPAQLSVTEEQGGGYIQLRNLEINKPIYDIDGITGLTGSNYLAQVYAGRTPTVLRPASPAVTFLNLPGICRPAVARLPDVASYEKCYGQARVWEAARGRSYEEARARGGKFGFSGIYEMTALPTVGPGISIPIESFSLRAGLAFFTTGRLQVEQRLSGGGIEWSLMGAPGFRYLIEKRLPPQQWVPLFVLTNITGNVSFIDPDQNNSAQTFYRSRMLD